MFRELRRKDKQITDTEAIEILNNASYGVLSTVGKNGIPYGIPLNYCYHENNIYFHSAVEGHKLDNIDYNNRISFCVVTDVEIIPDQFNTKYMSVILFGTVNEVDNEEKEKIFKLFLTKYSNEFQESGLEYIHHAAKNAKVFKISIDYMTGKGKK